MTYHSAKGLDFESVFLPLMDEYTEINQDENLARRLFYVAATRSRRTLSITYSSPRPHALLQGLPGDLLDKITISASSQIDSAESNIDNIF